jgi:hypothetical protein
LTTQRSGVEPEQLFVVHAPFTQTLPLAQVVPLLVELVAPQYVLSDLGSIHLMVCDVLPEPTFT